MKTTAIVFIAACALSTGAYAKGGSSGHTSSGSHYVSGHTTKNGTYVQPHHATHADKTKANNWSQKGNVNPYKGKEGTKN